MLATSERETVMGSITQAHHDISVLVGSFFFVWMHLGVKQSWHFHTFSRPRNLWIQTSLQEWARWTWASQHKWRHRTVVEMCAMCAEQVWMIWVRTVWHRLTLIAFHKWAIDFLARFGEVWGPSELVWNRSGKVLDIERVTTDFSRWDWSVWAGLEGRQHLPPRLHEACQSFPGSS